MVASDDGDDPPLIELIWHASSPKEIKALMGIVSLTWVFARGAGDGMRPAVEWRTRSGTGPNALAGSAEAARFGFETMPQTQGVHEYVVAEALDASGTARGASVSIPVHVRSTLTGLANWISLKLTKLANWRLQ
ncbi:hypothetical protein GCM10023194_67900 [Planotetraspora phitsanulokensis]|uniref:Uncharacterized protein n=2 Tax=Planotetraspora phitsanulokensis TaxID=575192 RepID=A0A8J3U7Q3_9ACTN|nr:hypothetical protein Pph01_46500 [Planotetraspora phitsanulokensis]